MIGVNMTGMPVDPVAMRVRHRERENEMKTVLKWSDPHSIQDILTCTPPCTNFRHAGVYLWEENRPGGDGRYQVIYVGKANNIWKRQLEHYWYQLGGAFLLRGCYRECEEDWGLDLSKAEVRDTLFNLPKFIQLVSENFNYINRLKIHVAPVAPEDTRLVEANLIYQLQPEDNLRGKASSPAVELDFDHQNQQWTAPPAS